ncbi:unnamed protein product, partial [Larinioides sclopetarius]
MLGMRNVSSDDGFGNVAPIMTNNWILACHRPPVATPRLILPATILEVPELHQLRPMLMPCCWILASHPPVLSPLSFSSVATVAGSFLPKGIEVSSIQGR